MKKLCALLLALALAALSGCGAGGLYGRADARWTKTASSPVLC